MKSVGKPDAGNRHVRFDERGKETGGPASGRDRAFPRLYPISEQLLPAPEPPPEPAPAADPVPEPLAPQPVVLQPVVAAVVAPAFSQSKSVTLFAPMKGRSQCEPTL
jgi:hypothetical protein